MISAAVPIVYMEVSGSTFPEELILLADIQVQCNLK